MATIVAFDLIVTESRRPVVYLLAQRPTLSNFYVSQPVFFSVKRSIPSLFDMKISVAFCWLNEESWWSLSFFFFPPYLPGCLLWIIFCGSVFFQLINWSLFTGRWHIHFPSLYCLRHAQFIIQINDNRFWYLSTNQYLLFSFFFSNVGIHLWILIDE